MSALARHPVAVIVQPGLLTAGDAYRRRYDVPTAGIVAGMPRESAGLCFGRSIARTDSYGIVVDGVFCGL